MRAMGAGVHALHAVLYVALYAALYSGGRGGRARLPVRRVLLCMLDAVEGGLCLLELLEVMRFVLLCVLEAVEGELSSP